MNRTLYVLAVLAMGNFAIATCAFTVVGLLHPMAVDLGISIPVAGQLFTVYAIAYALGSPFLIVFSGRLPRRNVILIGTALVMIGALASALAPNAPVLYATRVLVAFGAALYTPTAALIALTISEPSRRILGLSLVVSGLTVAQIVGIPLGTYVGGEFGWRWGMAIGLPFTAVAGILIARLVPRDVPFHPPTFALFGRVLRDWRLGLVIGVMAVMGSGQNMVSSYIAPIIAEATGAGTGLLSVLLIVFGVAALAGNMAGGILGDRIGPVRTLLAVLGVSAVTSLLFPLMSVSHGLAALVTALWAFSTFAAFPPQQARVVSFAPTASGVALSLNATAIYVGTAIGASVGGGVIALKGAGAVPATATVFLLAGMAMVWFTDRLLGKPARPPEP